MRAQTFRVTYCNSPSHALRPPRRRHIGSLSAVADASQRRNRARRSCLRSNLGHPCALGELLVEPDPFPGRERRQPRRIPASRAAPTAKGRIASPRIFLGCSVQTKGIVVRVGNDLGVLVQNGNFNSKRILLILVKPLENCRKIAKMQTQFCWTPCEENYKFCYTCPGCFLTFLARKIEM
jgi:hypothetical protein